MTTKVKVPLFDSVNKNYERYCQEIDYWCIVGNVDKKQQAVLLAYDLPENDPSGVRDKVFNELSLTDLNADDGDQDDETVAG